MKNLWIPLLSVLMGFPVFSQASKTIALEEVLNKVQESNTSIKISSYEATAAKADYAMSNAVYLPNISISHTAIATTNPLMAFGSKLNQEILTQADFNTQLLNNPNQIENFATRISVEQPLINMDGIFQRKAAKSTMKARALQYERSKDYLNFEAKKAYAQLQLAYKSVEVLEKALKAAQANEGLTKDLYEQGLIQKADLLQAQVRVSSVNDQLASAKSNVKNASDYLAYLMDVEDTVMFKPATELLPKNNHVENKDESVTNRSDIKAMAMVSKAYEANYKADQLTFLPRLNAFGSYELFDDQIFSVDAKGYTFGASLSWDVFEGSKRFAKVKKGKAHYEKAKLEFEQYRSQSELELLRTKRMLEDAKNRLGSSELALLQSSEALAIRSNRFKEGLEKTSDLLFAEAQYAQIQLAYYQNVFEFNIALAYYTFLTKE